jgi:hypothetical protein
MLLLWTKWNFVLHHWSKAVGRSLLQYSYSTAEYRLSIHSRFIWTDYQNTVTLQTSSHVYTKCSVQRNNKTLHVSANSKLGRGKKTMVISRLSCIYPRRKQHQWMCWNSVLSTVALDAPALFLLVARDAKYVALNGRASANASSPVCTSWTWSLRLRRMTVVQDVCKTRKYL